MNIRHAVRAGSFYEASASSCRLHAGKLLTAAEVPADVPARPLGGLVPHAGWVFSGRLAALTFNALFPPASQPSPRTVVLLGADHVGRARVGEVFDSGVWLTPLGEVAVDAELAAALLAAGGPLRANPNAHATEHSIEVQLPLLQMLDPRVKIVPIAVPPTALAVDIGETIGRVLGERFPDVPVVGSTDLTHHGGHFGSPGGKGLTGVRWSEANDRRLLARIDALDAAGVIGEAATHHNACGAGAIAATIAACRQRGATAAHLLEYTHSYAVMHHLYPADPDDSTVGYASVIFS
ncbi:MAG: AmmeMemoRadiSam system protein B [Phycisphaerae bacterium]|nr:AmmeMemoRadiSam system protein B [Phycisphaerae bacterium]